MHSAALCLVMLPGMAASADVEIHRCAQEDGTVAFQGTPCPELADDSNAEATEDSENSASTDSDLDFVNPFDEPEQPEQALAPVDAEPSAPATEDRLVCEKSARNAIDSIEVEMRAGYSIEEGQVYLAELLELTQQLRACKQLQRPDASAGNRRSAPGAGHR